MCKYFSYFTTITCIYIYILIFNIKATKDRAERKKEERGMTSLTSVKFETMP